MVRSGTAAGAVPDNDEEGRMTAHKRKILIVLAISLTAAVATVASTALARGTSGQTLTIWSYDNQNPGLEPVLQTLSKNFEASHPGVKINLVFKDFTSLTTTIGRALQSGAGPDVTEGNQGFQTDGQLVRAKLILPLDKYATKYHWSRWYGAGTAAQFRWSADGKHYGTGQLYGVAQAGQHVAVFYNASKLKQLGINPAKALSSLGNFEAALATARAKLPASEPVLMLGNKEGYDAPYVAMNILGSLGKAAQVRNWIFHNGAANIDTPTTIQAFSTLQSWAKKGYLPTGVNALAESDAVSNFAKGQGVFSIEGVWYAAIIKSGLKGAAGAAAMPPAKVGGQHASIGSTSGPWHISAKTKNPDLAAAWLNYIISSPAAVKLMYGQQQIPAILSAKPPKGDPFLSELVASWTLLNKQNGLLLYADWASPTMLQTISQNLQKMLGGRAAPSDVAKAMQDDWTKFNGTLR
jgi:raffinose/stachyose/melibiose transport system substrate-binding protein